MVAEEIEDVFSLLGFEVEMHNGGCVVRISRALPSPITGIREPAVKMLDRREAEALSEWMRGRLAIARQEQGDRR